MTELMELLKTNLWYLMEENRRKTFKKWVFKDSEICNSAKMAEAGFVFIGDKHEPDSVKCFFCNKSLDGWDSYDDPWVEHQKHASKCSFAKLHKSQNSITVSEFLELRDELIKTVINNYFTGYTECIKRNLMK